MGKISPGMKYMAVNQARRRRDERGRYMDGGNGMEMRSERGNNQYTRERRGMDDTPDMRYHGPRRQEDRPDMGGEGYFIWDNASTPAWEPPQRYGAPNGRGEDNIIDMRQYGRRYSPGMTMGGGQQQSQQRRQIGFQHNEDQGEQLTKEIAERWVAGMKGADGSKGGRWKYNEIRQFAQNFGITGEHKVIEFFAIINAMASDYGKVAKKFGVDKVDFYAELAKAWMDDEDAVPGKAMAYYDCIVRKDE